MGPDKKDIELLSAFIDGELSKEEEEKLEDRIKSSMTLQKQLDDLIKLKNQTSSVKRIPESPFFEASLMAKLESSDSTKSKIYKWSPAISLAVIILAVMTVLKFNPGFIENLWEQQKTNIAGFYKENLQPLLYAADLTNEDIFNFAINSDLPIDTERKQYLLLGYDENGKEYFEIKTLEFTEKRNDYNNFISSMKLNDEQKQKVDSILGKYAQSLKTQILVNENSTFAINPNLWNYRKAIAADLVVFAQECDNKEFEKYAPVGFTKIEKVKILKAINSLESLPNQNYIFLTPDSIFTDSYVFDPIAPEDVELQIKVVKENARRIQLKFRYDSTLKKFDKEKFRSHEFDIRIDSNHCRIFIPEFEFDELELPDFDSITILIDEATENVRYYSHKIPKVEHFDHGFKIEYFDDDSLKSFEYEYENYDYDSLIDSHEILIDSFNTFHWRQFELKNDSMISKFKFDFDESFKSFDHEELEAQMELLREEMERFREEMEQWQNEFRKESSEKRK